MISKTIGTGGDYADINAAINAYVNVSLTDHLVFTVLNDLTNTTDPTAWFPANRLRINNFSVTIDLNGKVVSTTKVIALHTGNDSGDGTVEIYGGELYATANLSWAILDCQHSNGGVITYNIHDIDFRASSGTTWGIFMNRRTDQDKLRSQIWNCRMFASYISQSLTNRGFITYDADNFEFGTFRNDIASVRSYIENCSIYMDDGFDTHNRGGVFFAFNSHEFSIKNVAVLTKNGTSPCFTPQSYITSVRCADSDGSMTVGTGHLHTLASTDFVSVDTSSDDYLKIGFDSILWQAGSLTIEAWNTSDFLGNPRPNANGLISIGAHEPIAVPPVPQNTRDKYLLENKTILGFKLETTPRTMETLSGVDFAHLVRDVQVVPDVESYAADDSLGMFSKPRAVSGRRSCAVNFKVDLYTNLYDYDPPTYFDMLRACGWAQTVHEATGVSIRPSASANNATATIWVALCEEGSTPRQLVYKIRGAMGSVKFKLDQVGKPIALEFSFIGSLDAVTTLLNESRITPASSASSASVDVQGAQIHQWNINSESGWEADYMTIGNNPSFNAPYAHVITFASAVIPKGAIIDHAYMKYYTVFGDQQSFTCNAKLYFTNSTSPTHPTSATQAEALSLIGPVNWSDIPAWLPNNWYSSPDLASLLQQIVNKSSWQSGNSLQFVCRDDGSSVDAVRGAYTSDAVLLDVEYHTSDTHVVRATMSMTASLFGKVIKPKAFEISGNEMAPLLNNLSRSSGYDGAINTTRNIEGSIIASACVEG